MKNKTPIFVFASAIGIIFVLLIFVILLWSIHHRGGLFPPYDYAQQHPNPKEFREFVGNHLGGIELPESTTELHMVREAGMDPTH